LRAGDVLRGAIKPAECAAFGKECTPRHPLEPRWSQAKALARLISIRRFLSAEELASAGSALTEPRMSELLKTGVLTSQTGVPAPLVGYPTM